MSATSFNPLFEVIVQSLRSLKQLTIGDVVQFIVNFPKTYEVWWLHLVRDAPLHVLIETSLIIFIIWLILIRRTVDPKKASGSVEKLSQKEIDWLIETWQPEPLVPKLNESEQLLLQSNPKVIDEVNPDTGMIRLHGMRKFVTNVSSFDFFGLSRNDAVKQAARDALDHYGCGSCGPRGFYGTIDVHLTLESAIAKFMGYQEAILYSDGASAVASAIPAFAKKGDLLIVDEACAEPIMTGANLSRSTVRYFKHNDIKHLESLLEAIAKEDAKLKRDTTQQRRFIVVEGIYRHTGDICLLKDIIALKEKYFYRLILDETYSFGILGKTGRGVTEYLDISKDQVEIMTITLDTVLASVGGICLGNHEVVDHQRLSGAGYCFSASLAPFLAAAAATALKILENDGTGHNGNSSSHSLITTFHANTQKLFQGLLNVHGLTLAALPQPLSASSSIMTVVPTGIFQLVLTHKLANDLEEARVLIKVADECLRIGGIAITVNKYGLIQSKVLRPSLMICTNAEWEDDMIHKICETLTKALRTSLP